MRKFLLRKQRGVFQTAKILAKQMARTPEEKGKQLLNGHLKLAHPLQYLTCPYLSPPSKGLGTCARELLLEVSTIRSMDVVVPIKNRGQLRLRLVAARPDKSVAELLAHLGLALPTSPKIIPNVVEKIA
jgi:hypothetical protein